MWQSKTHAFVNFFSPHVHGWHAIEFGLPKNLVIYFTSLFWVEWRKKSHEKCSFVQNRNFSYKVSTTRFVKLDFFFHCIYIVFNDNYKWNTIIETSTTSKRRCIKSSNWSLCIVKQRKDLLMNFMSFYIVFFFFVFFVLWVYLLVYKLFK